MRAKGFFSTVKQPKIILVLLDWFMLKKHETILVIGASGQVGSELTTALRRLYGKEQVVAADVRRVNTSPVEGTFEHLDCTDAVRLFEIVSKYKIRVIYHLAALLSVTAEANPRAAWELNINGLQTVLEVVRVSGCQLFVPSSIAAFGADTPQDKTPQVTVQRPTTLYGITKVAGELLCDYYVARYNLDVRGLRYPGLISVAAPPGGGTTDYAVELLRAASQGHYSAPLKADTMLDMMYMPDAVRATLELMHADPHCLRHRNAYNVTAFSLSPASLATAVKQHYPAFELRCEPNPNLQAIADGWPNSLDDSEARKEWGWQPAFDLNQMTEHALEQFAQQSSAL